MTLKETHRMNLYHRSIVLALCLSPLGLTACETSQDPTRLSEAASVESVVVEATPGQLTKIISVTLDRPARVEVDYWISGDHQLRVASTEKSSEHRLPVGRLLSDQRYQYSVRAVAPDGTLGEPRTGTFDTEPLPPSLMQMSFETEGSLSVPMVLLSVIRSDTDPSFSGLVIIDQEGRIVWFWEAEGGPNGTARRANGNFVFTERFSREERGLKEVSPLGEVVSELSGTSAEATIIHHDVLTTEDGKVLFLTLDSEVIQSDTAWQGDRIVEWDPEANTFREVWDVFDFYSPADTRGPRSEPLDWGHANSLAFGPRGNLIVSLQFLDQIISISPDRQSIEWKLGGPDSDFQLPQDLIFSGQHTASEVDDGHVLLFDNGREREDGSRWSRGLELALGPGGEVTKVWEFRPEPDLWSRNVSSVLELPSGNRLLMFGSSSMEVHRAFEVTREGTIAWNLVGGGTEVTYRAIPIETVVGEVRIGGGL